MRNIDWLCENDREALSKIIAEGDECEYCAFEIEDDCGIRCCEGVRKWLEAEHDCQYGEVKDMDTREKLEADIHQAADEMEEFTHGEKFINTNKILRWLDRQAAITRRECEGAIADELNATLGSEREKALEELVQDWQALYEYPDYGDCIRLRKRMQELGIEVIDE